MDQGIQKDLGSVRLYSAQPYPTKEVYFYWCNLQEYLHIMSVIWSKSHTIRTLPLSVGETFLRERLISQLEAPVLHHCFLLAAKKPTQPTKKTQTNQNPKGHLMWIFVWSPFSISSFSKRCWLKFLLRKQVWLGFFPHDHVLLVPKYTHTHTHAPPPLHLTSSSLFAKLT